ncbi:FAD-dependent oxidoreductase [Endozoicomonas sp. SM1973]|uniref:FAD-dependent oxidoreductase n=1 Tax=Spartinivicinus marinus TaxID=2994442 RepID=A0A853HVN8_9GAMM|nr:FAD-dependent oxidoreductase [Spartinivicinus marinus]MCX4026645.1 FAD-dependent oxidoreductase [Spartinivicinus marinus]NYZ64479.1 FAD-dependent oxidoreductase [Spartinivicinus marinus]
MTKTGQSRLDFLKNNPHACAWSALNHAVNQQQKTTPGPVKVKNNAFSGKRAVIIGSGIGGLTTAYELLAQQSGMEVIILEAHNRTGGRCLTLRTGDTLTEDKNRELFNSIPGETQVVRFDRPLNDSEPYLNAGPGRIPSSHKRLLHYLKKFGVDLEVYVMNSGSNLTQMAEGPFHGKPIVNRRLDHNTRGWLAEMVYQNAQTLIESATSTNDDDSKQELVSKLQCLMVTFGNLTSEGKYQVSASIEGQDDGASDRAGYTILPGVDSGEVAEALSLNSLLDSEFWKKTRFYQPEDFLWQPTLFQPVGGMDRVQHAFAQQIAALGGTIYLNSPVQKIDWDDIKQQFTIYVSKMGSTECEIYTADYCFSNAAIPFLKELLSERLQCKTVGKGFSESFKQALQAVYQAQFSPDPSKTPEFPEAKFLACTTKVGWQADRYLWQGSTIGNVYNKEVGEDLLSVPDSEMGVVPIFGGISWTDNPITQIWYPSTGYHDQKGTLTGCYNFQEHAFKMGNEPISKRLDQAREGAKLFGEAFGNGLTHGVAIAWQNMPYIKGGWAQWYLVGKNSQESVKHFNQLIQGTGVDGDEKPNFFIIGDQVSSLPGWQEGAIASALNALSRLSRPDLQIPHLSVLPDTRVMVESI